MPPVRGQVSYFVALHEIGHLVGAGRSGRRLESEEAAWRFALAEALVVPDRHHPPPDRQAAAVVCRPGRSFGLAGGGRRSFPLQTTRSGTLLAWLER